MYFIVTSSQLKVQSSYNAPIGYTYASSMLKKCTNCLITVTKYKFNIKHLESKQRKKKFVFITNS